MTNDQKLTLQTIIMELEYLQESFPKMSDEFLHCSNALYILDSIVK